MPNRLSNASSPYLQQHADNPVDWYEWGEDAFSKAKQEDKPIFLSVGYSSCHWCHVMAHESFEDREVAELMNEHFVNVKVDREERPDVDSVYMGAVQALTGHGGWPMSIFLTPEGVPFFGGTYWPREDRHQMPGFPKVLAAVVEAWENERERIDETGARIAEHLRSQHEVAGGGGEVDLAIPEDAAALCVRAWDIQRGGFGGAPKFPQAMTVDFLLAHHLRTGDEGPLRAASHSLDMMSRGGIHDQVAGGFHRYSVDADWLVPHFEKMLYDNALLLRAYTHAWQVEREPRFRRVALATAEYLLRDLRHSDGAFYSATDADSEGEEGKFFVWEQDEFREVVQGAGEDPDEWAAHFGVTAEGNFRDPHVPGSPSRNILTERGTRDEGDPDFTARLERVRRALYERRETRVHPGLDDKVLTSWNALAAGALAETGAALDSPHLVRAAQEAVGFLRERLLDQGRLHHTWKEGHGATVPAFLEDVAYLAQALLCLYEADHDAEWFRWAAQLAEEAQARFADEDSGTYFSTAHDAESLVTRPKDLWDNATPSGASVMADVNLRLWGLTGDDRFRTRAERTLAAFQERALQAPTGHGELLRGMERLAQGPLEVAVSGTPDDPRTLSLVAVHRERWRPGTVLAVGAPEGPTDPAEATSTPAAHAVPLLHERPLVDGAPAAYVCRLFACERPVTDPTDLRAALG